MDNHSSHRQAAPYSSESNSMYEMQEKGIEFQDANNYPGRGTVPGRRRRPADTSSVANTAGDKKRSARDMANELAMGRLYRRLRDRNPIVRYMIYYIPVALLIGIPIVIGSYLRSAELGVRPSDSWFGSYTRTLICQGVRIVWIFCWVQVVWTSVWGSLLVARILPGLVRFFVGVISVSSSKYTAIISNLERPLTLLGWSFSSFITFLPIMTQNPTNRANNDTIIKDWEFTLNQLLAALVVCALIYLGKCTLVHAVAIDFHKVSYEERITKSKSNIHMLTRLYDLSRALFPVNTREFAEEDRTLLMAGVNWQHKNNKKGQSVTDLNSVVENAKRAIFGKTSNILTNVAGEISGNMNLQNKQSYATVINAISFSDTAKVLARRIWFGLVEEGRFALTRNDLYTFLPRETADAAFESLDGDENGDITLEECEVAVVAIGKERAALQRSMRDIDSAIHSLDRILLLVIFVIMIFVLIAFLNRNFTTTLATAGTTMLSMSFIFATTAQEFLASIVFLFHKHPYDVGDLVRINNADYIVRKMSLLFTVFKRTNGTIVQTPNNILNTQWVENISRSHSIFETIVIKTAFSTTFEQIDVLRDEMFQFVSQNSRDFIASGLSINLKDPGTLSFVDLEIDIPYKANWKQMAYRRNAFLCALVAAIRKAGIVGSGPSVGDAANPMHIVKEESRSAVGSTAQVPPSAPARPAEGLAINRTNTMAANRALSMGRRMTTSRPRFSPQEGEEHEKLTAEEERVREYIGNRSLDEIDMDLVEKGESFNQRRHK